jgi:hypothetical protein
MRIHSAKDGNIENINSVLFPFADVHTASARIPDWRIILKLLLKK